MKRSIWDKYSTYSLMFFVFVGTGDAWGSRIAEGKITDMNVLYICFTFALIYNLYSVSRKLWDENEMLKEEIKTPNGQLATSIGKNL